MVDKAVGFSLKWIQGIYKIRHLRIRIAERWQGLDHMAEDQPAQQGQGQGIRQCSPGDLWSSALSHALGPYPVYEFQGVKTISNLNPPVNLLRKLRMDCKQSKDFPIPVIHQAARLVGLLMGRSPTRYPYRD